MTNERDKPDDLEHDDDRERWRADEAEERAERELEQPIAVYGSTCYGERYAADATGQEDA